jgi:flagellar basal-body rod protein FlgB
MSGSDPLFGIHASALSIQRRRMELLASNIANADTPGYQARDIDFKEALAQALKGTESTAPGAAEGSEGAAVKYRIPMQPAADGNTVDVQTEQGAYMDAAMHYQASLSFLDGRLRSLLTAITGE